MNLHISMCAAWALLFAAWARAAPYRHDGLQPLVELRQNECTSSLTSGLTPEREDLNPCQHRSCEVRSKMPRIQVNTMHVEHSPTVGVRDEGLPLEHEHEGSAWKEFGPQDLTNYQNSHTMQEQSLLAMFNDETRAEALRRDPAQDRPDRREPEPQNPTDYQIQDYLLAQPPYMLGRQTEPRGQEGGLCFISCNKGEGKLDGLNEPGKASVFCWLEVQDGEQRSNFGINFVPTAARNYIE